MTTEPSEDYETPITGLPLFTQTVTAVREQREVARPLTSVAHLSTVSTTAPIAGALDWSLVSALRAQASEQLSQAVAADRGRLDKVAQEELGRTIVLDLIETTVADRVNATLAQLKERFPQDLDYNVMYDTTVFVKDTIHEVVKTLL